MDASQIDLNRVAMFVQIARAGGVTAAAAKLKVPKSSVSRALSQLESELGVELVVRGIRGFRLTDAGRTFFDAAARGIETVNDAREELHREKAGPRGLVRVAAPPNFAFAIVAPTIARFVRQYPEVHVELSVTGRQVDPARDGFDLVVSAGKLADSSSKVRTMMTIDLGIFASPEYLRERGTPRRPTDLARHECILRGASGKKDRWELIGPTGPVVVAVDGRIRVDDLFSATAAAVAHGGLVVLPLHAPRMDPSAGTLTRVLPEWIVRGETARLVYPAARHVPLRVTMLCDAIVEHTRNSCRKAEASMPSSPSPMSGPRTRSSGRAEAPRWAT